MTFLISQLGRKTEIVKIKVMFDAAKALKIRQEVITQFLAKL